MRYDVPDFYDADKVAEESYRARYEEEPEDLRECEFDPAEKETTPAGAESKTSSKL